MNVEQKFKGGVKRRITNIPEELQIVILSHLPPKVLSRCQCVSKHWNTTLTIQAFMLRHSRSYDKHSKLAFMVYSTTKGYDTVLSFELSDNTTPNRKTMTVPKTTKMTVRNSRTTEIRLADVIIGHHERFTEALFRRHSVSNICNDLICRFDQFSTHVGLLNLKTQDFIHLPSVCTESAGNNRFWYALGFDPVSKVYKVLSIYGGSKVCRTKAALFTLGSNHWKPIEYKFLCSAVTVNWRYWRSNDSFCLDGVIYWVDDNEINGNLTVVGFDLYHEVFRDYKLDTISIKDDVETIKYYLTSLRGCPTLFIWRKESDEIQQFTLFNHKNPTVAWNKKSIIAHDFPKKFPYGCRRTCVAGGSILLDSVKPMKSYVNPEEQDNPLMSWYIWYDLENLAIE
ncbi:putative F-box protein At1g32420 [Silene latifolia]|uniref:putative F-box protein At1g32420 n=1 Tax=Silene latifolia TaxID=37657 RepID=UPI003D782E8C